MSGYLIIVLSVASLDRLIRAVEDWEQHASVNVQIGPIRCAARQAACRAGSRSSTTAASSSPIAADRPAVEPVAGGADRHCRPARPSGRPLLELYPSLPDRGSISYYRDALAGEVHVLVRALPQVPAADHAQLPRRRHRPRWRRARGSSRFGDGDGRSAPSRVIEDVTERVISERELRNQIAASEQARAASPRKRRGSRTSSWPRCRTRSGRR